MEGRKEFLDQEGEWWYDTYNNADSLYYYAANGVNPNRLDFRGKVQSYAFSITGSQYVQIKNLEFLRRQFTFPMETIVWFTGVILCIQAVQSECLEQLILSQK